MEKAKQAVEKEMLLLRAHMRLQLTWIAESVFPGPPPPELAVALDKI
jgi:hypothetical protein